MVDKLVRLQCKCGWRKLPFILEVLENEECTEVKIIELDKDGLPYGQPQPAPVIHQRAYHKRRTFQPGDPRHRPRPVQPRWALRFWDQFEPIFRNLNGECIHAKDERLSEVMVRLNRQPQGIGSYLTGWVRAGKIVRVDKGMYRIK